MTNRIQVNMYEISPRYIPLGTRGSYGNETFLFTFSEEWNGLTKIITFYPSDKSEPIGILLGASESCELPPEISAKSGIALMSVQGYREGQNIISHEVKIAIDCVPYPVTEQPTQPTPSMYEQLLTIAQEADATAQSVRDDADNGEFDGKDSYPISRVNSSVDILAIQSAIASEEYSSEYGYAIVGTAFGTYHLGDFLQISPDEVFVLFNMVGQGGELDNYYTKSETDALIGNKVDKVPGYNLSQNSYTNSEKATVQNAVSILSSTNNLYIYPDGGPYSFLWVGANGTEFTYTDWITKQSTTATFNFGEFWSFSVWGAPFTPREYLISKSNYSFDIPSSLAELLPDENHRTVTDAQIANWNDKLFAFNDTDDFKRLDATEARFFIWNADEEQFTYTGTDDIERTTTFDFGEVWTGTYNSTRDHYFFSKIGNINEIADITNKESTSNKVTSLSASSTDTEYPSAKCVYDLVGNVETLLGNLISGGGVE